MRRTAWITIAFVIVLALPVAAPAATSPATTTGDSGLVFRYYAGAGLRFQPLLSFARLEQTVSRRDVPAARRLATALLARGVSRGGALYWPYDFSFGGGPATWTSGFTQAVAASALARAGVLLRAPALGVAADRSFLALRRTLLLPVAGGLWIREYSFTGQVILNAQLESILQLDSYARIAKTPATVALAARLARTAARLLPQFDLGCWGRYQLGGVAADTHYEAYHVDLLRRLAATHPEPVWRDTYRRWAGCLR